jgi:hypothetical protein
MFSRRSIRTSRGRAGGGDAAAAWTPASITGADLMLEADAGITLNSSNVSAWADQSAAGKHFAQATGALQPAYQAAGGPGGTRAALYFSGASYAVAKRLIGPAFSGSAAEVFFIAKKDSQLDARGGLCRFGSPSEGEEFPWSDGNHYASFGSTTRKNAGAPGTLTSWFVANWISTATEWTSRLGGVQKYTTASNTVGWHTSSALGADTFGVNASWAGHISAVYKFTRKLTTDERTLVEAYILTKWGV